MRPINRIKHVVDTQANLAAGVTLPIVLVQSTDTPTLAASNTCETGSKVNGIYIRVEASVNEAHVAGAVPNFYLTVNKNPGGNLTLPAPNNVGVNDNKRFVFHQEMTMLENKGQGSNARTIFNGVVVIPKGYRRNGPNDTIFIQVLCPSLDTVVCFQAHYKEFR